MPLYSLGLCDAVICAPPSWRSRATADREVHHVGAHHAVVDDVRPLAGGAVDERVGERGGGEPHVARNRDAFRPQVGHEAAADLTHGLLVDL
jgi:hypothetical protein